MSQRVGPPSDQEVSARLLKAVLVALLALGAMEEVVYIGHRVARVAAGWWEGVEHRGRSRLGQASVGYVIRRLAPR